MADTVIPGSKPLSSLLPGQDPLWDEGEKTQVAAKNGPSALQWDDDEVTRLRPNEPAAAASRRGPASARRPPPPPRRSGLREVPASTTANGTVLMGQRDPEQSDPMAVWAVAAELEHAPSARREAPVGGDRVMFDPRLRREWARSDDVQRAANGIAHGSPTYPVHADRTTDVRPRVPVRPAGPSVLDYPTEAPVALSAPPPRRSGSPLFVGLAAAFSVILGGGALLTARQFHEPVAAAESSAPVEESAPSRMVQGIQVAAPFEGAFVLIDGTRREELPVTIDDLSPGRHFLRFEAGPDFQSVEREIVVKAGQVHQIDDLVLPALPGKLTLQADGLDEDAQVWLVERQTGDVRAVSGPFPTTVSIPRRGYELLIRQGDDERRIDADFPEGSGTLTLALR